MLAKVVFLCLLQAIISQALPSFIKACKDDDKINQCIMEQSDTVIKEGSKGSPEFGIPVLEPFHVDKIEQWQSGSKGIHMNFTLEDIDIHGISKSKITQVDLDTKNKVLKLEIFVPELKYDSKYKVRGQFSLLPISGDGKSLIVVEKVKAHFIYKYKAVVRKGVEYLTSIPPSELTYEVENMKVNLENLAAGGTQLGEATNTLINENWKAFNDELGPGIAKALAQLITSAIDHVASSTPFDQLILH